MSVQLLWGCGETSSPQSFDTEEFTLLTADGYSLRASLYRPARDHPPGLILVHMLGSDRSSWSHFASRARLEGYMCLAIDLRGHGGSTWQSGERLSYRTFNKEAWAAVLNDLAAAKDRLVEEGADKTMLAFVGASIGANLSLTQAAADRDIQAVVALSPGMEYKGIALDNLMARLGEQPVLLLTSMGDSYSASTCTRLKEEAAGHCELRTYPGSAHGTDILAKSANATDQIFQWLETILGVRRPGESTAGVRN